MAMRQAMLLGEPIKTEPRDSISPSYGAMIYTGNSPAYTPSPQMSPHFPDLAPTPSPEAPYRHQSIDLVNLNIMPQIQSNWNLPATASQTQPASCSTWNINPESMVTQQTGQVNLLDLDTNRINSGDLQHTLNHMNMSVGQLPEINNLSLTDIELNPQSQNMTDSLTNFLNETANKLIK